MKKNLLVLVYLGATATCCLNTAFAETLISETDVFSDLPLVSSVSRMSQPINKAPASITIIDRELIDASGAQSWVDLFHLVPGMQAYSINANRPGIDYHGIGSEFPRQIEVTVDGRSVYQPLFSTVEWSALNVTLDDIDYIEVVRGSNAASQGSNAFKGAINIVTKKPNLTRNTEVSLTAGSRDTQRVHVSHNNYLGEVNYQVNLGFDRNDGFPGVWNNEDPEDNGPLKDGRDFFSLDFTGIYTPNITDTYELNIGGSHNHTGWGDVDHPDEFSVVDWDTVFESLKWNRIEEGGSELSVHAYHNNFKASNDVFVPISGVLTDLLETEVTPEQVPFVLGYIGLPPLEDQPLQLGFGDLEANRYDIELEHRLNLADDLKLTWGAGYRYEDLEAQKLLDRNDTISLNNRRLFASSEWSINQRLTFNIGGMLEDTSTTGSVASYRSSLNYHPNVVHGFRLAYAHGERAPSLLESKERNLDRLEQAVWNLVRVSDTLCEEEITTYELAYMAQFGDKLSGDVRVFREESRDLIVDERDFSENVQKLLPEGYSLLMSNAKVNRNGLDMNMDGVELQLKYRPMRNTLIAFHYAYLDLDGTHADPLRRSLGKVVNYGERVVPQTASLLGQVAMTDNLAASMWVYHMDEVKWDDGNFVDEVTRVDMQLRYKFPFAGKQQGGAISLVAQNIGKDYADFGQNNIVETGYYVKLEMELP